MAENLHVYQTGVRSDVISHNDGNNSLLSALKKRVSHPGINTSFTRAWYEPGMKAMVPPQYYDETVQRLNYFLPQMTPAQEHDSENFSLTTSAETGTDSASVTQSIEELSELA